MLKKTLLSVLAVAAVTACSKDEITTVNPNPEGSTILSFSPVVPKATRGTVTKIDGLQANGFYVVAFGSNDFYFNRLMATYKADGEKGPGYYLNGKYSWPSYDLTFAAWYPATLPANGGSAIAYDNRGNVMSGEYVSQPVWNEGGTSIEKGQEIREFVPAKTHATQTDIVVARTIAKAADHKGGAAVQLNFRHILSQISFKAKKASGDQLKIEIKEVELRNVPSKGTFSFRGANPNFVTDSHISESTESITPIPLSHWTIVTPSGENLTYSDAEGNNVNLQSYKHTLSTHAVLEPVAEGAGPGETFDLLEGGNMMLIPTDFTGNYYSNYSLAWPENDKKWGTYFALKMKVFRKVEDPGEGEHWAQIFPADDDQQTEDGYGKAAVGIVSSTGTDHQAGKWEPGYHYIYTLNFTDKGVGKHDPETEPKGGEDILGEYMYFTVSVDEWVDTNSSQDLGKE